VDVLRKARNLWIEGYSGKTVMEETGIPVGEFARRKAVWDRMKEKLDAQILERVRHTGIEENAKTFVEKGLFIGNQILDRMIKRGDELTPKDFSTIMQAIVAIHRVKQLEGGEPTEISKKIETMSPEQVAEYVAESYKVLVGKHTDLLGKDGKEPGEL
jgi:hypothetical protein